MSSQRPPTSGKSLSRRSALRLGALGLASGSWAYGVEPNLLSITRKDIHLPRWPKALDGFRIAQITDVHFRPGQDDSLIEKLCIATNEEKPDLIAITGDFVTKDPSSLPECTRALAPLKAAHGIFASPGNHDRWHLRHYLLKREIEGTGMALLLNQGTKLTIKGESIFLNGLDSVWGGQLDPAKTWKGHKKTSPVISLLHEPDPFETLHREHPLDLQLSGHTHGGQCRVPVLGYAPAKVKYGRKYLYGEFAEGRSRLFVGRGLGTVAFRVRFACAPELAILTLRSSP